MARVTPRAERVEQLAYSVVTNARLGGVPWTCYLCPKLYGLYIVTVVAYGSGWKLIWETRTRQRRQREYIADTKELAAHKLVDLELKWMREAREAERNG